MWQAWKTIHARSDVCLSLGGSFTSKHASHGSHTLMPFSGRHVLDLSKIAPPALSDAAPPATASPAFAVRSAKDASANSCDLKAQQQPLHLSCVCVCHRSYCAKQRRTFSKSSLCLSDDDHSVARARSKKLHCIGIAHAVASICSVHTHGSHYYRRRPQKVSVSLSLPTL